jgi:hypothetical protein
LDPTWKAFDWCFAICSDATRDRGAANLYATEQHENDNENQDCTDHADAAVTIAIAITANAAAEAAKQKYDQEDDEYHAD